MAQDTTLGFGNPGIASFASESFGGPSEPRFGEGVPTTTHETVTVGADTTLALYSVVSVIAGVLALATIGTAQGAATATVTVATAVPAAGDKFTINGTDYVFRSTFSTGPTVANEVKIGADIATTRANLIAAINGTGTEGTEYSVGTDTNPYVSATAGSAGVTNIIARDPGDEGNAITLAKTFATGANGSVSAATLSGGSDDPDALPFGILAAPIVMTNGQSMSVPFYREGHWDMDQLVWAAGWTNAQKRRAFENSRSPNIFISKKKYNNDQIAV